MANNSLDNIRQTKVLIAQVKSFCETVEGILYHKSESPVGQYASYLSMASIYNDLALQAKKVLRIDSMIYTFNTDKMPSPGDTVWSAQKNVMEQVLISAKILLAALEGNIDFVDDEFDNIENFFSSRLRSGIFSKPDKEVDVQNAVETLLLGRGLSKGVDYDRETGKIEFSGKEYIPDFIIPKLNLCIEIKLLRAGRKSNIIEEISADITAYRKVYSRQLYIVYDLGVIQNEFEFRRDIETNDGVKVLVVKH